MSTHIDGCRLSTDSNRSHTSRTKESPTPLWDAACTCTESREGAELKRIREECFGSHVIELHLTVGGGGTVASTVYRTAPGSRCTRVRAVSRGSWRAHATSMEDYKVSWKLRTNWSGVFLQSWRAGPAIAGCWVCCVVCRSWSALGRALRALRTWWSTGRKGRSMYSNR